MRIFSPKNSWLAPPKTSVPDNLQKSIGGHTIIGQTLVRRGISNLEEAQAFIDPSLYRPSPPTEMPGLSRAVTRIREAIDQGELILIWGDFDVDGQTSTTLLVEALRD
ncbi:MAG: single-stranded-DNA-specific exonuclease RecJ, partial [Chloroflexota bacterium]